MVVLIAGNDIENSPPVLRLHDVHSKAEFSDGQNCLLIGI